MNRYFLAGIVIPLFLAVQLGRAHAQPSPHGAGAGLPFVPHDTTHVARDLRGGTIVVRVKDENGSPKRRETVTLLTRQQSPAIGERTSKRTAVTNARGEVVFMGLKTTSEFTYTAQVRHEGALYGPDFSPLLSDAGLRITIHTFPTTRSLSGIQVGMMGLLSIEPSDSVLQLEMAVDIVNLGRITWLPDTWAVKLPANAKAFEPWERAEGMDGPLRFVQDGPSARLVGTVRPGQHRVGFRFQVENPGYHFLPWLQSDVARVDLNLPSHVVRFTVLSDQAPGMRLAVAGFEDTVPTHTSTGRPALASSWVAQGPDDRLTRVSATLTGFRTRGSAPFYSVLLSALLLAWGVAGLRAHQAQKIAPEDIKEARRRLLAELLELDRALADGRIGPKTHATARRTVVAALARLEGSGGSNRAGSRARHRSRPRGAGA